MMPCHHQAMAQQLVDSRLATTRAFWREKLGYPQFARDPRPLAELIELTQLVTKHRPDPDLDRTLSAVNDAINQPGE